MVDNFFSKYGSGIKRLEYLPSAKFKKIYCINLFSEKVGRLIPGSLCIHTRMALPTIPDGIVDRLLAVKGCEKDAVVAAARRM